MKYKTKIIATLLFIALVVFSFTACGGEKEVVDKIPLDTRYTPQHQEVVTTYEYKYDVWGGGFKLLPNAHTETIPERYEVHYRITYTDDSVENVWEEVSKVEYDVAESRLKELQEQKNG